MEWYYVLLVLTYTESAIHESSALKLAKTRLIKPKTSTWMLCTFMQLYFVFIYLSIYLSTHIYYSASMEVETTSTEALLSQRPKVQQGHCFWTTWECRHCLHYNTVNCCTVKTGWLFQVYSGYPSCRDSGYVSLSKQVFYFFMETSSCIALEYLQ